MAKKKKVLTDNDYEEFNKWMTEQESKPTPGKIELVHDPSLRMFQSWFVVSDLQCFCPLCSNRRAFAFGKRQPRGGCFSATAIGKVHWTSPSPLNTLNIGNNKCDEANLSDWISNQVYRLGSDAERFR